MTSERFNEIKKFTTLPEKVLREVINSIGEENFEKFLNGKIKEFDNLMYVEDTNKFYKMYEEHIKRYLRKYANYIGENIYKMILKNERFSDIYSEEKDIRICWENPDYGNTIHGLILQAMVYIFFDVLRDEINGWI